MKKLAYISILSFAFPLIASAQGATVQSVIQTISDIINSLLPILITLGLLYFVWGLVEFIKDGADSPDKKEAGRSKMLWGVISLFVIVSVWGLVEFVGNTFDIDQGGNVDIPQLPGESGSRTPDGSDPQDYRDVFGR